MIRRSALLPHRSRPVSRQSSSFTRRRYQQKALLIAGGIGITLLLLWGISGLSRLDSLAIKSVEVYGTDPAIATDIQAAVNQALSGNYIGLFARANRFLYSRRGIVKAIETVSSQIERAEVQVNSQRALVVTITEKNATAIVCGSLPDFEGSQLIIEEDARCHFVDRSGRIFEEAPLFVGTAHKRYYFPDMKEEVVDMPQPEFEHLQKFYDDVRAAGIPVQALLIKPEGEYELYIPYAIATSSEDTLNGTTIVYFNALGGMEVEKANFISFWSSMVQAARAKGESLSFDSIDLRYGSNVFYRLNN
jgi:hypothetical protein